MWCAVSQGLAGFVGLLVGQVSDTSQRENWEKQLKRPITVERQLSGPLGEVLMKLARGHNLTFGIEVNAFEAAGIKGVLRKPVKVLPCRGRPLRAVLVEALRPLGCECRAG